MEYTVTSRKNAYLTFMSNLSELFNSSSHDDIINIFKSKKIASGVEGSVFLSAFKHKNASPIIIKQVKLKKLKITKTVYNYILNASPKTIYKLFETYKIFKQPAFIEIVSQTLTNQLIFQNICPNFSMNYYWEFDNKKKIIYSYNEYVNSGDFDSWAKKRHSKQLWFNALFQIMYGLICLKRYFNMIHSDFHTKNILVKRVKSGGYWIYTINNINYHLPNLGYIFLIHDLGFSWIPKKLYVKWHVNDTLSKLSESGVHYYDISTFINQITYHRSHYIVPSSFKQYLLITFHHELNSIFDKKQKQFILLEDKFKHIFNSFSKVPNTLNVLDTFSADKQFDKSKIPSNFYTLIYK